MRSSTPVNCKTLDLNHLGTFPLQPDYFDELSKDDIQRLAKDIERNGLRHKIEVLGKNKAGYPIYTILKGHQRRRALLLLGKTKVEVIVREDLADADTTEIEREFLEDNQNRRQLDPLAKARVAARLFEIEKGRPHSRFGAREEGELRERIGDIMGMCGRHAQRLFNIVLRTPIEVQNAFRQKKLPLVDAARVANLTAREKESIASRLREGEPPRDVIAAFLPCKENRHRRAGDALASFHRALRKGVEDLEGRLSGLPLKLLSEYRPDLEEAVGVLSDLITLSGEAMKPTGPSRDQGGKRVRHEDATEGTTNMMTPEHAREQVRVYDDVEKRFLKALRNGGWKPVESLLESISDEQAQTAYRLSCAWIKADHPDWNAVVQGTYRRVITQKLLDSLLRRQVIERSLDGGMDLIRLVPPVQKAAPRTAPKKQSSARGVRAARHRAKSTSGDRPSTKKPKKEDAHAFGEFAKYFDLP